MTGPAIQSERGRPWAWPLVLVAVVTAPCWPAVFGPWAFFWRDIQGHLYPLKELVRADLLAGHLPWWDWRIHCGVPFFANPNTSVLHPTTLLYALMPVERAFAVSTALLLAMGALGAWLLARQLDLGRPAAFCCGATFALCGPTISHLNLHPHMLSLAPLPLVVATWNGWLLGGSVRWLAGMVAAASSAALGGGPEACLATAVTVGVWTFVMPGRRGTLERLLALAACGAAALVLTAPAWTSAFALAHASGRHASLSWAESSTWSLAPRRLPELLVPGLFGSSRAPVENAAWGWSLEGGKDPFLGSIALGPVALLLAAWGLLPGSPLPKRLRIALLVMLAVAFVVAMAAHVPGLHALHDMGLALPLRYPSKALELASLPFALLTGAGIAAAVSHGHGRLLAASVALAGVLVLAAGLLASGSNAAVAAVSDWILQDARPVMSGLAAAVMLAACLSGALAAALWVPGRAATPRYRGPCVAFVLVGSLLPIALGEAQLAPTSDLHPDDAVARVVQPVVGSGRLVRIEQPRAVVLHVSSLDVIHIITNNRYMLRLLAAPSAGIPLFLSDDIDRLVPERMAMLEAWSLKHGWRERMPVMRAAGVTAVLVDVDDQSTADETEIPGAHRVAVVKSPAGSEAWLYQVDSPLATVRFVTSVRVLATAKQVLDAIIAPDHDPAAEILVTGAGASPPRQEPCAARALPVSLSREGDQDVAVDAPRAGYLFLAMPFLDGLETRVDGRPAQAFAADFAFVGVPVAAGHHAVQVRWRPPHLRAAVAASLLALPALLAAAVFGGRWWALR